MLCKGLHVSVSPSSVDALLMCGEGAASRPVLGDSKIYLPVNGRPLFLYVLDALSQAGRVRRIFIVGDKQRIESAIKASGQTFPKPVNVVAQGDNLLENVWRGFISTLDAYGERFPTKPLRETRVPVPGSTFDRLGIKHGNVFADYTALYNKHPEYFPGGAEDVKAHVERVMQAPEYILPGMTKNHRLLVRVNGENKAVAIEIKLKGGKYRIESALNITTAQLKWKIEKANQQGGRLSSGLASPRKGSHLQVLPQPRDLGSVNPLSSDLNIHPSAEEDKDFSLKCFSLKEGKGQTDFSGRVILALSGDSPLVTPGEIDGFIAGADMGKYDYVVGLTPAAVLAKFRPSGSKPGVSMSSFHLREGLFRISNLHLARPFAFKNRDAVLKMYEMRYQRNFSNVLRFARSLLATPGWRGHIWLYLALQMCLTLSRMGLAGMADVLRRLIPADKAISAISQITGARAGVVITTHGGAALDIDNESDYRAMTQMFDQWRSQQ